MRIRSIKPEFWTDERVGQWTPAERLAYIWTWSAADDCGKLRINPALLRAGAFPYDETMTLARAREILARLSATKRLCLYVVDGQQYGVILRWADHQRVDHPGKSTIPDPTPESEAKPEDLARVSRECRESVAPELDGSGNGNGEENTVPTTANARSGPAARIVLNRDTRKWEGITDADRDAWEEMAPGVDVDVQLAKAANWCLTNGKRGRKKDYARFLSGWFGRSEPEPEEEEELTAYQEAVIEAGRRFDARVKAREAEESQNAGK